MSPTPIELRAGELRLALRPDLGGCHRRPVAAATTARAAQHRAGRAGQRRGLSGCYPLVPYSNRLGYRRFRWLGQDYTTAPNFDDNPHSVHGVAWQRPWQVAGARSATEAELRYAHAADAHWPFAFELRQRFVLTPTALEVHLAFTNQRRARRSRWAWAGTRTSPSARAAGCTSN